MAGAIGDLGSAVDAEGFARRICDGDGIEELAFGPLKETDGQGDAQLTCQSREMGDQSAAFEGLRQFKMFGVLF